jgi:membrane protein DedA with SNARE-associated domain
MRFRRPSGVIMSELIAEGLRLLQNSFAEYGYWFVLLALFLENVMFLGTVIPGAIVLVMAGGLAQQQGHGFPYWLALAGYAGTLAGDMTSFAIGRKLGHRILQSKRWGKGMTAAVERVRREPALLMFCHFGSYLRMFVPASAGMSGVPFRRWLPLDAIGAGLWVLTHVAAGYFLTLSGAKASSRTIGAVIVTLVVGYIGLRYLRAAFLKKRQRGLWPPGPQRQGV